MSLEHNYAHWFQQATGYAPYPFQVRFACEPTFFSQPSPLEGEGAGEGKGEGGLRGDGLLVDVPTGLGKTAMAVLGWLWRRTLHPDEAIRKATPRRLVYCLPMRVLVEQTADCARTWIENLKKNGGLAEDIPVHVLMGGEEEENWDMYPDREQILVGTQDMLLSRALNRGYAATRSRWPMKFGLLNMDCLWVFDEIQLMGAGLATTAQLEAFRRLLPEKKSDHARNGHGCCSVWMSATLQRDWLKTVDFAQFLKHLPELRFRYADEIQCSTLDQKARQNLDDRWKAKKPLAKAKTQMGNVKVLAQEVLEAHRSGARTIVILNTVKRAREVFDELTKNLEKASPEPDKPELVLLHSRFRPGDRKKQVDCALAPIEPGKPGTIVVSTQVIEAGVDVSATTLFTEVAPWASLVQRFGRCNREGKDNEHARVYWISLPEKDEEAEKVAAPYELDELKKAQERLSGLSDVGLPSLPDISLPFEQTHVIRRKDLIDLFDTTPDLAGNDIDIDRFIRDVEDSDVQVFWRDYGETEGTKAEPMPRAEELCSAPIGEFKKFVADKSRTGLVWRWNFLERQWDRVSQESQVIPGQVYLVHVKAGGYSSERGWDPSLKEPVQQIESAPRRTTSEMPDATDADPLSQINRWQTIAEHTTELCRTVETILQCLNLDQKEKEALTHAARWHDRGKAHQIFQAALPDRPPRTSQFWAKAPEQGWKRYTRQHFRHELASALAVLDPRNTLIPEEIRNLVAYLVAAHHGKVRLSIRSLPNENRPDGGCRFARGVWDGDELPETDLGSGVVAPRVTLSLEPMELGLCEESPFDGLPSWAERMIRLRDQLGPFRLAYLEAVLRAADWRASRNAEEVAIAHGEPRRT
ncbi:MAG: CRISPR-associated helicase Cas3' [Nitrospira sp.]|nr:CRISPR-associated helicase Cas3' [Nitrospira sp.]